MVSVCVGEFCLCQLSNPLEVVRPREMAQFDQDEISKSQRNEIR